MQEIRQKDKKGEREKIEMFAFIVFLIQINK